MVSDRRLRERESGQRNRPGLASGRLAVRSGQAGHPDILQDSAQDLLTLKRLKRI